MANSKRKCKQCCKYVTEWVKLPVGVFCTVEHALEWSNAKRTKDKLKEVKKRNQSFKKKVELSDIKGQKDKTQSSFNKLIKLEELWRCAQSGEQPICISCSKPWTPLTNYDFAAGHYFSRGARPDLALNNNNVFLQCNGYCNSALSANKSGEGKTHGYDEGLIYRLGFYGAHNLIERLETERVFNWTGKDYETLRKWLNARARYLTKELELFNDINQE
jgi:hypothetical protein